VTESQLELRGSTTALSGDRRPDPAYAAAEIEPHPPGRLRLGLAVRANDDVRSVLPLVQKAERLGYQSVWTNESYGSDCIVPLTWIAAHTSRIHLGTGVMQMPGRTPAMTAMTAMTLDRASDGRLLLGLGASGPQVAEGWHGQSYGRPLGRTREYVSILREVLERAAPLEHHGEHYDIPYSGPDATGLGKPLKSVLAGRPHLPIYLAALGPKNVRLAVEIADGWLPALFSPQKWQEVFGASLAGRDRRPFDIAATVRVVVGDDVSACCDQIRPWVALYIGGMGAAGKNFYNDMVSRLGFEEEAARIQGLYLAGAKAEAAAAVSDRLVDEIALVGPVRRIADRLQLWADSPVTTLVVASTDPRTLETMAEITL
jgi:F420-dependent oxidoreductase-like protein